MGFMALNLTANILGMGNAATPMGLKAMEELQTLNPKKDTATNSMVMLLAMHATSIQLLPPVLVIAVMGLRGDQRAAAADLDRQRVRPDHGDHRGECSAGCPATAQDPNRPRRSKPLVTRAPEVER